MTTSCGCYRRFFRPFRLFRDSDLVDAVLSVAFALAFSSLVFAVARFIPAQPAIFGRLQLVCIFEPTFSIHVALATSGETRFLPFGFALPFSFVAAAFFCQGIDLHVV